MGPRKFPGIFVDLVVTLPPIRNPSRHIETYLRPYDDGPANFTGR